MALGLVWVPRAQAQAEEEEEEAEEEEEPRLAVEAAV